MEKNNNNNDLSPLLNPFFSIEDKDWIKTIDKRYYVEESLLEAIKNGDVKKTTSITNDYFLNDIQSFSYLSNDIIYLAKMFCRVSNITFRVAARQGGLLPLHTHNISEKFSMKIMMCDSKEKLLELPNIMALTYAKAVNELSCNRYSPEIAMAIKYIIYNLSDKITLLEIAEHVYTNSTSLSRKFKKETGFTVVDYINYMRIQTAKILILKKAGNMTEIANVVGYSSASYFNKAFLKHANTTPKNYQTENTK